MGRPKKSPVLPGQPEVINPADWGALTAFSYNGVTYGRNEPVPAMPVQVAAGFEQQGAIAKRVAGTANLMPASGPMPKHASDFVVGRDEHILRLVRQHRPTRHQLQEIHRIAGVQGRSLMLQEALSLAIDLMAE